MNTPTGPAPMTSLNRMAAVSPASALSMANGRMSGLMPGMRRFGLGRLPPAPAPHPRPEVGRAGVADVQSALAQQQQQATAGVKLASLNSPAPVVRMDTQFERQGPVESFKFLPNNGRPGRGSAGRDLDFSAPFRSMQSQGSRRA
jgi:hypothetical protein